MLHLKLLQMFPLPGVYPSLGAKESTKTSIVWHQSKTMFREPTTRSLRGMESFFFFFLRKTFWIDLRISSEKYFSQHMTNVSGNRNQIKLVTPDLLPLFFHCPLLPIVCNICLYERHLFSC